MLKPCFSNALLLAGSCGCMLHAARQERRRPLCRSNFISLHSLSLQLAPDQGDGADGLCSVVITTHQEPGPDEWHSSIVWSCRSPTQLQNKSDNMPSFHQTASQGWLAPDSHRLRAGGLHRFGLKKF
ncbi:hypothetical protein CCHR01_04676 [Colletotrichum chrysophilum]|uniref:Secreted protein n=1 Tax=Colletotrichum chrysophilum TaxID=1836956 RepID=A0AAD9AU18_9PEZI|nr:hypothetical protein CCHR01_04676 [Colletotrichum chrysophilum]